MVLQVNEIFYSLQGEGARAGEASLFIRLKGCSAKYACHALGIQCDTEFESGTMQYLDVIHKTLQNLSSVCKWIIWTGGEPCDQLTSQMTHYFKERGYKQAIETSGIRKLPENLDYVCVSPKVAEHVLAKNFTERKDKTHCDELRYVRHSGQTVPEPSLRAAHYLISPHSDGNEINQQNLKHCIALCKKHPTWKLSVQQHKLWNVL